MTKLLLAMVLALGMAPFTWAGELDNDGQIANQGLRGSLIVRVDGQTGETAYLKSDVVAETQEAASAMALSGEFSAVPAEHVRSELDRDAGASSWFLFFGHHHHHHGYYYPAVYWYGYYYNPYYTFNYGYYNYYYYYPYWRWYW